MACSSAETTVITIDQTNASASIEVTGRAFVNSANDVYNGVATTRWNRSRVIRITGYTPTYITFDAIGIPSGDGEIGVVVDNAPFATVSVPTASVVPSRHTVVGMSAGAKTVDLYEAFQERVSELDTGVDGKVAGTYVTRVLLPHGSGGVIAKVAAPNVIATFGDSHIDGDADSPISVNGWAGQLRRAGLDDGDWLVSYVGAGSSTLAGDGPDPDETAEMIHDVWADAGAVTKYLLMMRRPNDYAYSAFVGSIGTVPDDYQAYLEAVFDALDASDPGWTGILTRIPQGTDWGNNSLGFDLDDYWAATVAASTAGGRTNITTHDKTVFSTLNLATDYFEPPDGQVHLVQSGHDKVFAVVRTWYGL